jgi:hypothetical protein
MMPGQGKPLPKFMQLAGEWIFENQVFLHHAGTEAGADFTRGAERLDGSFAVGFSGTQLATAFGLELADIIEANQVGTLIFVGTAEVPPVHGGSRATAYFFRIGDSEAVLNVETYQSEGRA